MRDGSHRKPARASTSGLEAAGIGLLWLVLTVAFELLFGHYGSKQPWRTLLEDYNLTLRAR